MQREFFNRSQWAIR